jgi:hypothetical protein
MTLGQLHANAANNKKITPFLIALEVLFSMDKAITTPFPE